MTVVVITFATWLTFPGGHYFCVDRTRVHILHRPYLRRPSHPQNKSCSMNETHLILIVVYLLLFLVQFLKSLYFWCCPRPEMAHRSTVMLSEGRDRGGKAPATTGSETMSYKRLIHDHEPESGHTSSSSVWWSSFTGSA